MEPNSTQAENHSLPPTPVSDHSVPQRTINSHDLFQGAREIHIQHDEKIYRLQVTRNGKLILIK